MKRRLFAILAALSLVLCLACAGVWVRSYWRCEGTSCGIMNGRRCWDLRLQWWRGTLVLRAQWVVDGEFSSRPVAGDDRFRVEYEPLMHGPFPDESWPNGRGFFWKSPPWNSPLNWAWNLGLPCWLVTFAAGVMPALWLRRFPPSEWGLQRSRMRQGLCRVCGYDLRATPERCPECGTAVPSPAPPPAAAPSPSDPA